MPRRPKDALVVEWSRREHDFLYHHPAFEGGRANIRYVHHVVYQEPRSVPIPPFEPLRLPGGLMHPKVLEELERRGFDTQRMRIVIPIRRDRLVKEGTNEPLYPRPETP